jgi:hypothetical protein
LGRRRALAKEESSKLLNKVFPRGSLKQQSIISQASYALMKSDIE